MRIIRIIGVAAAAVAILMAGTQFRSVPAGFVPVVHAARAGCSNESLRGDYGFQIRGTIVGFGPIVGVALLTFDGDGNFVQTDDVSVNGAPILDRPGTGTYTVNPDCTGTETLNLPGNQTVHTTFVIAANGNEIFDEVTDPHVVITGIGKRVASPDDNEDEDSSPRACSQETLKGAYATSTTGFIVAAGPVGAIGDVGRIIFDGNGGASQITTVAINGALPGARSSLAGSYKVNPDCTGEFSFTLPGVPVPSRSRFVVVERGNELLTVNSGVGRALAGIATRLRTRGF